MDDDGAFATLVEEFRRALGTPQVLESSTMNAEMAPAAVGEKRSRLSAEEQPRKKIRAGACEWMVVFNGDRPKKQRYHYSIGDDRVAFYIEKGLAENLFISSVASSSNLWAIMLEATGFTDQIYKLSGIFLDKEWIVDKWNEGLYITSLAGNDRGHSLIVMSKGMAYAQQSYKISKEFPFKWVKKKWREGFFVTALATSAKQWAVVASRTTVYRDQIIEIDCAYSPERWRRLRDRGLRVTAVGATKEDAVVVLSVPFHAPQCAAQEVMCTPSFPSALVKTQWTRNMYISAVSCGCTTNFEQKGIKLMINRPV